MAEDGSNDGGDGTVGCEDEVVDNDGDNNDNGVVEDDGGVDVNDDNDANGGDGMRKTNRDDDADGGGGNSNDDGGVDRNGIFGKLCIDGKGDDETDDSDEQTESVVGDLAKYNGSSKKEIRVGVMQ